MIGPYERPKVRLPGAGGASEIADLAGEVLIILRHDARAFVERLDFVTSVGFLEGGDARERAGLRGRGPTAVITDLCILEPDPTSKELLVTQIHPGVTREQIVEATGWPVRLTADVGQTEPPSAEVLEVLRDLQARTRRAHGEAA